MPGRSQPPNDLLQELRHEERWLGRIAKEGQDAVRSGAGFDDLVAELRACFALRRRLSAQLAAERELQELTGAALEGPDDEEPSIEDIERRAAG